MFERFAAIAALLLLSAVSGCELSDGSERDGPDPTPTVQPGETLTLNGTETVGVSGFKDLPDGTTFLTTRCFGEVSVTLALDPAKPITNSCSGDGGSRQSNVVAGLTMVFFEVAEGDFAQVTLT